MEVNGILYFVIYVVHEIRKVGCSIDFDQRKGQYNKNLEFEILDLIPVLLGDKFAGDQEWYYADWFGYPRGPHYSKSGWNNSLTFEMRSRIGKTLSGFATGIASKASVKSQLEQGIHNTQTGTSGFFTGVAQKASITSPNHNSKTRIGNAFFNGKAQKASIVAQLAAGTHVSQRKKCCPDCKDMISLPNFNRHIKLYHGK